MIPTYRALPLRPETPMDPLHDECSGMAELRQKHAGKGGTIAALTLLGAAFSTGMIAGAVIVWLMVITFTK